MSASVSHLNRARHPNDGIGVAFAPGTRAPESVTGHLGPHRIAPTLPEQSFAKRYMLETNDGDTAPPP